MKEVTKTVNGFETTVLEGDDADVQTESEKRTAAAGASEKRADVSTKARKSVDDKSQA